MLPSEYTAFSEACLKYVFLNKPGITKQEAHSEMQAEWNKLKINGKINPDAVRREINSTRLSSTKIKNQRQLTFLSFGVSPPTARLF